MNVSVIQADLIWENISANLAQFSKKINSIKKTDIIVLPEMFTTGFSLNATSLAETMNGPTSQWMKEHASQSDALLIGSIIIKEKDNFYNRCLCVFPNGSIQYYDKTHLFSYGNEDKSFQRGSTSLIIDYKGWTIKPLICYDLRFPVASRNKENYDLLIYVANWPEKRQLAWTSLLTARAIENQAYVIGVNRIGIDGMNLSYSGDSSIIDYSGVVMKQSQKEEILNETFDKNQLLQYRKDLPFLKDMDNFTLKLS